MLIPIVPGTDAVFLLAVLQVLFEEGLTDLGDVADIVNGVEELPASCVDFTPEAVEDTCNIPGGDDPPDGPRGGRRPHRRGLRPHRHPHREFGTVAAWAVDVL